jgi:hypothetical protein
LPPRIEELESLEHAPSVPAHNEGRNDETGPVLCLFTLDQDALVILEGLVHEIVDLVRYFFSFVEENLLFVILPVEGEILDANAVPVVGELHTRGVYYALNLVRNYEF